MEGESECPCHRFSGLAWGTAGQLSGCISSGKGVGRGVGVGHRIYSPKMSGGPPPWFASVLAWTLEVLAKGIASIAVKKAGELKWAEGNLNGVLSAEAFLSAGLVYL